MTGNSQTICYVEEGRYFRPSLKT